MAMKPIFLIGYMGCGKTTLGMPLAQHMGRRFVDLDYLIEKQCHMTARDIFMTHGEDYFRQLEREALVSVATGDPCVVVACGGGTPLLQENMDLMNKVGITIWLQTSVERITSRLILPDQRSKRPLLNKLSNSDIMEQVMHGLEVRAVHYSQAQLQFDSTFLESAEEIETSAQRLACLIQEKELKE